MLTQEVNAEVSRLAAERGWPTGSPLEVMLSSLFHAREEARHGIRAHLAQLQRDITKLDRRLNDPSPILNTLGELQQRPAAVEAWVGQFYQADQSVRLFLENFPKD